MLGDLVRLRRFMFVALRRDPATVSASYWAQLDQCGFLFEMECWLSTISTELPMIQDSLFACQVLDRVKIRSGLFSVLRRLPRHMMHIFSVVRSDSFSVGEPTMLCHIVILSL